MNRDNLNRYLTYKVRSGLADGIHALAAEAGGRAVMRIAFALAALFTIFFTPAHFHDLSITRASAASASDGDSDANHVDPGPNNPNITLDTTPSALLALQQCNESMVNQWGQTRLI